MSPTVGREDSWLEFFLSKPVVGLVRTFTSEDRSPIRTRNPQCVDLLGRWWEGIVRRCPTRDRLGSRGRGNPFLTGFERREGSHGGGVRLAEVMTDPEGPSCRLRLALGERGGRDESRRD